MTDDTLRDLGKQLPVDRPDATRREKVRASLLAAAAAPVAPSSRRWLLVGGGFAAGALAAAAAVMLLVRPGSSGEPPTAAPAHEAYARIESSTAAQLEHTLVPSATGTDEVVRVKAGTVRLAVPPTKAGDRVRVATGDAEIEGSGDYEVTVEADRIASVTVTSGTATLRVGHQQPVFLAAGQTWRASVQTADLAISPAPRPDTGDGPPSSNAVGTAVDETPRPTANPALSPDPRPEAAARAPSSDIGPPQPKASASPRTTASGAPIETTLTPEPVPAPSTSAPATGRGAPIEPAIAVEQPAPASAPPAPSSANPALSSAKPASAPPPSAAAGSDTETHFRAGAAALRANKLAEAATELATAAAGEGPLAADARYYQAVALIRAKRGAEAERALVMFLDRAPVSSTRRGRAAIMLAKLIADRGDAAGARAWYELAAKDADPVVSAAAKAALR